MNTNTVVYALNGRIGLVAIQNPPVNALSQSVRAGILNCLEVARNDASEALILYCEGKTFIAGADITEFGKPPLAPELPEVISALEAFPKPIIAAMHGTTLGGGLEVAMAAHYRIAIADSKMGMPEVKLGLLPGSGGTQRLPRLVGVQAALDMLTDGDPISAEKALCVGLVDQVVTGDLLSEARSYIDASIDGGLSPRRTGSIELASPDPEIFDRYRGKVARSAKGQIAPGYIVDLVQAACGMSIRQGQALERERFIECRESAQSAAMRHMFFAERATVKTQEFSSDKSTLDIHTVAVIGAGTMGTGIAISFANAGYETVLLEMQAEALATGLSRIDDIYSTAVKKARMSDTAADSARRRISGSTDYTAIANVDLVVEAVFEDMMVKKEVFKTLQATCKPNCILASNTSYLDIDEIAESTNRQEYVVGAHFFSPANIMKLLEVVRGRKTSPKVIRTLMSVGKTLNKVPVVVGNCHGFVGNRILRGYARQAQLLLLEGATPHSIDNAMEKWGMAMGPIAVGDLAGIDIGYRSRRNMGIEAHSQKEFALADTLAEKGHLGQKTGVGYYRYEAKSRTRHQNDDVLQLVELLAAKWGVQRREIDDEEIIDRLTLALFNEGTRVVEEGIASRPSDIDVIYVNGYGFPRWCGGPMFHAQQTGLSVVLSKLERLEQTTGDTCWTPSSMLQAMVKSGEEF